MLHRLLALRCLLECIREGILLAVLLLHLGIHTHREAIPVAQLTRSLRSLVCLTSVTSHYINSRD